MHNNRILYAHWYRLVLQCVSTTCDSAEKDRSAQHVRRPDDGVSTAKAAAVCAVAAVLRDKTEARAQQVYVRQRRRRAEKLTADPRLSGLARARAVMI